MKPVPLLLLLISVHVRPAAGRPRVHGWLDGTAPLDERDAAASDLLRFLQRSDPERLRVRPAHDEREDEDEDEAVRAAAQLLKRSEEPPLSIDLTFHLLRNMIQMAKMESQREQAQLNRKVLDEIGK
ncbi:urotensin 1 [Betta splendens]|uniref:Urotensin 1 n=1 Tax=Betta splendens TaxID=158456 RepID=A0A6P7LQT8_BETSP|nr:urotensin 1 [Betta splendens]